MGLADRLAKDSIFSGLNTVVIAVGNIVVSALVARRLEPAAMGDYSFFVWLTTSLALILNLGLRNSLLRFGAEVRGSHGRELSRRLLGTVLSRVVLLGVVWGLLFLVLAQVEQVGEWFPFLVSNALLLTSAFVASLLHGILTAFARSQRDFRWLAAGNSVAHLTVIVLVVVADAAEESIIPYITAYYVGIALLTVLLMLKYRPPLFGEDSGGVELSEIWSRLKKYSVSIALIVVIDTIVWQRSETFFLQWYGESEQLAFYSIAYDLSSKSMRLITASIIAVLLPAFAELYGKEDAGRIRLGYEESVKYLAVLTFPIVAAVGGLAAPIIEMIYGPSYLPAAVVLQILVVSASFAALAGAASSVAYAVEEEKFILASGLAVAVLNIGAAAMLVRPLGAVGAAIANTITQFAGLTVGVLFLIYKVEARFPIMSVLRIGLCAGTMAGIIVLAQVLWPSTIGMVVGAVAGSLAYGLLIVLLHSRTSDFFLAMQLVRRWVPNALVEHIPGSRPRM